MLSTRQRNLIFLEAGILTVLVYILAILLNGYLDIHRIDALDNQLALSGGEYFDTYHVSDRFYSDLVMTNCSTGKEFLFSRQQDLKKVGNDLSNFGKLFHSSNENISNLRRREYYLNQLQLYAWTQHFNEYCSEESRITPVLYFFDGNSPTFDRQGTLLEQFAINQGNKSIVFSFDINFEKEPILESIKEEYRITSTPFIIMGNATTRTMPTRGDEIVSLNDLTLVFLRQRGELEE